MGSGHGVTDVNQECLRTIRGKFASAMACSSVSSKLSNAQGSGPPRPEASGQSKPCRVFWGVGDEMACPPSRSHMDLSSISSSIMPRVLSRGDVEASNVGSPDSEGEGEGEAEVGEPWSEGCPADAQGRRG